MLKPTTILKNFNPDRATAVLCKKKLSAFVKEFWSVIEEDPLEWNWHMDVLCDEIQLVYERVFLIYRPELGRIARLPKLYDLIINVPPGTSKSTICTVMAPAWSWTNDASLVHITASYAATLSTDHAVKSRDIIRSDKYRRFYPDVVLKADQDNKTDYKNTKKGRRYATSVTGSVTGNHAHIATVDDALNPKQAASAAELKEANDFFDSTLPTRKKNKKVTPTILIMQRLAVNDPTGHILEKNKKTPDKIRHICLPGELSAMVKPAEYARFYVDGLLDPNRLDQKILADLKVDLGSAGYAGQISQTPVPEGGLIWHKWFREIDDFLFPDPSIASGLATDWDLAYTSEEDNAASAYVTSGRIKGAIYIFDFDWQWLEFPELIKWMKTKHAPHYIEAKASGKSAKQTLAQQGVVAVEVRVKGGRDKIARARSATPVAEAGMVYIKSSMADKLYNDPKQGLLNFPRGAFKDLADVVAQCLQRHSSGGVRVLTDEPDENYTGPARLTPGDDAISQQFDALDDLPY